MPPWMPAEASLRELWPELTAKEASAEAVAAIHLDLAKRKARLLGRELINDRQFPTERSP